MNYCVIPVRKNSRRVPQKNFRIFSKYSLLELAIQTAKCSGIFDKVYVASDALEAREIAERTETEFWLRSEENQTRERFLIDVVQDFISSREFLSSDILAVRLATNPFCQPMDIKAGFERVKCGSNRGAASFSEVKIRSHLHFRETGGKLYPENIEVYKTNTKSDAGSKTFYFNEGFVIDFVGQWLKRQTLIPVPVVPVFTNSHGFFIDDEGDFALAKLVYENISGESCV